MADIAPGLDELDVAVAAPAVLLSDPAGPVRPDGVQGWYVDDVRLLRRTFPVGPTGSASRWWYSLGRLGGASRVRANASSSAAVAVPTTPAQTRWPQVSSSTA